MEKSYQKIIFTYFTSTRLTVGENGCIITGQYIFNERSRSLGEDIDLSGFGAEDAVKIEFVGAFVVHFNGIFRIFYTGYTTFLDLTLICRTNSANDAHILARSFP